MDHRGFDALARLAGSRSGSTRRGLLGALAGALLVRWSVGETDAKKPKKPVKPKKRPYGADCATGAGCRSGVCVRAGRCARKGKPTGACTCGCRSDAECGVQRCVGAVCQPCGQVGQVCCAGDLCAIGAACHNHACAVCGREAGQPCCTTEPRCAGDLFCGPEFNECEPI